MKTRIITGAGYVVVMVAFFLLRELVNAKIFHLLTGFLIIAGTIECVRLTKGRSFKFVKPLAICYAVAFILAYLVVEWFLPSWGKVVAFDLTALMVIVLCVYAIVKKSTSDALKYSVLPFVYPSVFLLTMLCANDLRIHGFIILLLSFVISPLSDTFAYFTGRLIGGKKLCPKISPNKTWAGAIGGTIGGALGSLIVYFILRPEISFFSPVLFFILIGLVASVVNVFGDLFESLLKRRVGVKDSGKLLPGHGGVLDRIDGTTFVVPFLYLIFLLV